MKKWLSVGAILGLCFPIAWADNIAASNPAMQPALHLPKLPNHHASEPAIDSAIASAPAPENTLPDIRATAYAVYDAQSQQMLIEHGLNQPIEPASLTQLMTAYLVFQALESHKIQPSQTFIVSEHGWKSEGARMFLAPKQPARVSDLLRGLILLSGNDAAITLAEAIAGSEEDFVQQMNREAQRLGMTHTHFDNATGLHSDSQLSTVYDLLVLSNALMRDFPQYYPIYSEKTFTYNGITQPNHHLLLYRDNMIDGLKVGYSKSAGYHVIASSHQNGRRVISVLIGASSNEERATESGKLLQYALQAINTPKLYAAQQEISQIPVAQGRVAQVAVGFLQDVYISLPRGSENHLHIELTAPEPAIAPIHKGQVLGMLKISDGQRVLKEQPLLALHDVYGNHTWQAWWNNIVRLFKSLFGKS